MLVVPLKEGEPDMKVLLGEAIMTVLWDNADVFAWEHGDLEGVPHRVIEHKLYIDPKARPIKQGVWKMSMEHQ